jgi:hypothetical protein
VPVKRRTETVYLPRCWLNARGFKRLGDTFHLQQALWFRGPPSERCGANRIPDLTIAVAGCQQPQDAGSCVAIFSHGTLHYYTTRGTGKT